MKDIKFDDYLWSRIKKVTVIHLLVLPIFSGLILDVSSVLQTEAELLAEKKCVAHLTGEVI